MFPIKCKDLLPVAHLVIKSLAVRGRLGPLTVWVSKQDTEYKNSRDKSNRTRSIQNVYAREGRDLSTAEHRIRLDPSSWTKIYDRKHSPCPHGHYTELKFDDPVCMRPGEMRAIYIHSTLPGDNAIVYDNSYYGSSNKRFEDDKISILTGRAHVSTTCFGQDPIWGWGNAWRDRREFVGRLAYGTVYKLWNPETQTKFGSCFQDGVRALLLCQRRWESPFSMLPDEAIFYILNMCRWDWFNDNTNTMKDRRKREKVRNKLHTMKQQGQQERDSVSSHAGCPMNEDEKEDTKPSANELFSDRSDCNQSFERVNSPNDSKTCLNTSKKVDEEYAETSDKDEVPGDWDNEHVRMDLDDDDFDTDESSEDDNEYHRADRRYFNFDYPDSDDEEKEKMAGISLRSDGFRHQFARAQVLQALASMEDQAIVASRTNNRDE